VFEGESMDFSTASMVMKPRPGDEFLILDKWRVMAAMLLQQ
jgi:hypothetical protein